jgi:TonB-dependent receptor
MHDPSRKLCAGVQLVIRGHRMHKSRNRLIRAVRQVLINARRGLPPGTAAGATVLLAMGGGVATAADGPTDESGPPIQEVVVTGIRASIANAVQIKERSDNIIEAISAEDLGKLPDISIADSLARLPGLAAQRTDGRSNYISIRGFGPDFSGTTFQGREQASSGENRGVEFDQFPAELINTVEVYKTPDASLIGQGLAGTVNLNTVKPLSFHDLKVAINVRGERNSNSVLNPGQGVDNMGSRASFSVIDQFLDHTLGVAFGVARLDSPIQEKQYQAWYWGQNNGPTPPAGWDPNNPYTAAFDQCCGIYSPAPLPGDPVLAVSEEGMQIRAKSQGNVRTGVMGVLEWAPNDSYHSELDLFFSNFEQDMYLNGLQWSSAIWDGGSGFNYTNPQLTNQGAYSVLTGGTLNHVNPIMQNEYTKTSTRNWSAGWNNRVEAGGWTLVGDLSYSTSHVDLHDAYAFTGAKSVFLNGVGFQIPLDSSGYPNFSVPVNLADPSLVGFTDPDNYSYDGRVEFDRQTDTIKAVRFDVKHELGWIFKDIDVGFDYSDRKKVKSATVDFAYLNGNGCSTSNAPACPPSTSLYDNTLYRPVNQGLIYGPTSLSYGGVPGVINYNVLAAINSQFYLVQDMNAGDYNRNYSVEEKVPLAYVKLDIGTSLLGIPVRGNAGVQFVHTSQSSTALQTDPNNGQSVLGTVTAGTSYNNVLPSLNLVGDLGDGNILRLGAAKEMMRGRIDDEKAAASASVSTQTHFWSGSGGNPALKPYIAIAEDISYEKVFGKASYFSVGLFNKNLTSYIFNQTNLNYNFAGYTSPIPALSNIGAFYLPENGSGGKIQGYEIALVLEGSLFSDSLDGFGLQSNFAYTNNSIPSTILGMVQGGPTTFPGLSKKVAAATLYYEKYGFSIRIAETYRSDFTGEIIANFDQIGYTQILGEKITNFQAGYEFKGGTLEGLSFLLQINNLTNSPYRTVQNTTFSGQNPTLSGPGSPYPLVPVRVPLEYDTFGRIFLLGVNYKF